MNSASAALATTASLLVVGLLLLQGQPAPGGDRGVGHAMLVMLGHGALWLLLMVLPLTLGAAGRLAPLHAWGADRTGGALLFVALTAGTSALWAIATPVPWNTGHVAALALRLLPLAGPLLLLAAAVLLLRPAPAVSVIRGVIMAAALHTLAGVLLLAAPSLVRTLATGRALAARGLASDGAAHLDETRRQLLEQLQTADPARDLAFVLSQTHAANPRALRDTALARLATVPDWPVRAQALLATPQANAVFIYLASHRPPEAPAFARALPDGIRQVAAQVRARIRGASGPWSLYTGLMAGEVDELLASATALRRHGVDFTPALHDLRRAFAEPSEHPHPPYAAVTEIDRWLKRYGGP